MSWVFWDRFNMPTFGAVSGGEAYVARRKVKDMSSEKGERSVGMNHLMGKLDVKEGFGHIFVINQVIIILNLTVNRK